LQVFFSARYPIQVLPARLGGNDVAKKM